MLSCNGELGPPAPFSRMALRFGSHHLSILPGEVLSKAKYSDVPYLPQAIRLVSPLFGPLFVPLLSLIPKPDKVSFTRCLLLALLACLFMAQGCALRTAPPQPPEVSYHSGKGSTDLISTARSQTGLRYKAGGSTPESGFDCSGFVRWTFGEHGIKLPRTTTEQMKVGKAVRKEDLQPGDIVAFKISNRRGYHTGIYTGNGMFIHSPSSGKRISESSLEEGYWKKRFITARRVN